MPLPITQQEMNSIFEVTDSLEIHREKIRVSLAKKDPGSVLKNAQGVFQIVVPESGILENWLKDLKDKISQL